MKQPVLMSVFIYVHRSVKAEYRSFRNQFAEAHQVKERRGVRITE